MATDSSLSFGPFWLDTQNECLRRGTEVIKLTPKAFAVLRYLVEHPGRLVTKDEIFAAVWKETVVSDITLAVCVREIRKSLGDEAKTPQYIETMHRRGYRFIAPLTTAPPVVSRQLSVLSQTEAEREKTEIETEIETETEIEIETKKTTLPDGRLLSQDSALRTQHFPTSRFARGLILAAVLLILVTAVMVHYLSLPVPSTQPLTPNTQSLPLPDKPSIIVLPFVNMSGDPEQEYFSDGLTEVLTTDLSKIASLFVIARNSAFTYKEKATKVQDVSREMGVRYVLEGGVLRTEGQVRVTAQLIDATTGYHLWSERYDRPFRDIFAVQDEIVQKIVTTLNLQIAVQEQGMPVRKTTTNLEAYDAFLRGVGYAFRLAKETNPQARQMFERAIALDPQYPGAYAMLGWTYYWEWTYQWNPDPRNLERAEELARQALALTDALPGAHGLLSRVYWHKQQSALALASAEQAVALDPNFAEAYIWRARALMAVDKPTEALRDVEQAVRLNPRYPFWYSDDLGLAYRLTGRYEESIAAHQQVLLRNPKFQFAYVWLVINYAEAWLSQQRQDPRTPAQALETAQRAVALNASSSLAHVALSVASLINKQYVQAEAEVEQVLALNPGSADLYASAAGILNWVGRPAEALKLMEQALHLNPRLPSWYFLFLGQAYYLLGRTAEAIAPLQRVLSVYPHRVEARVLLAAVYSELGKAAEARAEAAEVLRLNPKFSLEVHRQRMPIKDPTVLERHIVALRKAGLQ
jgi:TolB-like protein/DNA-binding winged helix-turn-helix (wHTH) protein/tetratricopeptide (TPR) repeat protein